jgi:hypothetical protein
MSPGKDRMRLEWSTVKLFLNGGKKRANSVEISMSLMGV